MSCSPSGKTSAPSKRNTKKAESGKNANAEVPSTTEDAEKNQKIMQWIIEGEKEISRHRKAGHGYVHCRDLSQSSWPPVLLLPGPLLLGVYFCLQGQMTSPNALSPMNLT